jgi:hypothetical protein
MIRCRALVIAALTLVLGGALPLRSMRAERAAAEIPAQLSDRDFWQLSASLSEPPGSFRSENLVSNETMFQWVIPDLTRTVKPGGVYLGVAPDQNFTYIVATRPAIAFIVDIRRGNVLEHLLYKALLEMSADRAEFLSRLFSCAKPAGIPAGATAQQLLKPFYTARRDARVFAANQRVVLDWIEKTHGFTLSKDDENQLVWIYGGFFSDGPELTYSSYGVNGSTPGGFGRGRRGGRAGIGGGFGGPGGAFAGYGTLQMEEDAKGVNHAYLASDDNFAFLKSFETKNLIVPLTGDFAGPKALRAVGAWVRQHGAVVTTIYTSNVEQYLFMQDDDWSRYYQNISTLPIDATSTFIRSIPNALVVPAQAGARSASMLSSVTELVKAFADGKIHSYSDIAMLSRQ